MSASGPSGPLVSQSFLGYRFTFDFKINKDLKSLIENIFFPFFYAFKKGVIVQKF